jgi:alkanesulfonate monooxygenase SsuD/methylene tetrahydromethanopterin reductase-like flavin-dependent oxidoreductase (luciferase family)
MNSLRIEILISGTLNWNSKMKFGLIPSAWGNIKQDILRQANLAYELGFSSVMVAEQHGSVGFLPSPLITLAAISQHLPKMEIGTTAAVFPLYDPVRFAADCAVLDRLTDGRPIVGLVAGYRKSEFDLFNVPLKERARRMDGIKLISDLWEGREVVINRPGGAHPIRYRLGLLPIQKPRPPIWIGGWAPRAVDRAVRL